MNYKIGDVVLFAWDSGILAKAIRFYNWLHGAGEDSKYVHAGIIIAIDDTSITIGEAIAGRGLDFYPYSKIWAENAIAEGVIKVGRPNKKLNDVQKAAYQYLGRDYGYMDLLNILLAFIPFGTRMFSGAKNLICSEFVARVLYEASNKQIVLGYDEDDESAEFNKRFDQITPFDLRKSAQIDWGENGR